MHTYIHVKHVCVMVDYFGKYNSDVMFLELITKILHQHVVKMNSVHLHVHLHVYKNMYYN